MAAPTLCCPFEALVKITEKEWKSADLIEIEELHTASICPHPPLKKVILTGTRHGQTCTITPLFIAIEQGDLDMVKIIIEKWGVDIHAARLDSFLVMPHCSKKLLTFDEVTPLFAAALYNHYEIVRYLVEQHGANFSAGASFEVKVNGEESRFEVTPLHGALLLLDQHNVESVQLDIIRFLVECGADPSPLSSNIPLFRFMFHLSTIYAQDEDNEVQTHKWINPNALFLLVQLGMSVTQKCPENGSTILHMLAGSFIIENLEVFVQFLLQKGAGIHAPDNHGFTPIMYAAAYNDWVPNITFLNYLLERKDIPLKDKIEALEVAAAVILSNEMNAHLFQLAFDYLARARELRIKENRPLTPQPLNNNRAIEWITSITNEQNIEQHPDQFAMQSILIRLRIFSAMSWQAVYEHLWPFISLYINELEEQDIHDQLLDISWTMLETITCFSPHERGIWIATVEVVRALTNSLENFRSKNHPLYSVETLENSLKLVSITYQNSLDDGEAVKNMRYYFNLVRLVSLVAELPSPTDIIIDSVRKIGSKEGRTAKWGWSLFHVACQSGLHHLPADNLLAVIKLLMQLGADPHAICGRMGRGALHYLAIGETNRRDIEATARLLLDMRNGVHLDKVDYLGMTAADCYKKFHPEDGDLPDWLQEGVPKLTCLSARVVSQSNEIHYEDEDLPTTLDSFVQMH